MVPWWRDELPLVYSGDELLAVADVWLADSAFADSGAHIQWDERPNLY
ncbi:MAG: TilS substrate C-terminal domain-containing protein [Thiogranum sp.]